MRRTIAVAPLPISEKPGDRIGRYKLLQQIGEGGCGVVYLAEQSEPVRRRVALKVIKPGMDTRQVIARFEAERQALAMMDHPNIAKVFDGGVTETGRPFFVMELVKGLPITRYCDEHKLDTAQRLELFVQVCEAIQHAHQKEIIHRDIKPSNILVFERDGTAVPKVIDFGIAKAISGQSLTDKTLFTAFDQFIGTPTYMSPEQAELTVLEIDHRSDVYSLGVLLYELLTGRTPFDPKRLGQAGLEEVRRIIREEDPVKPSTRLRTLEQSEQTTVARSRQCEPPKLIGLILGDLDWIVMKTLEKDRTRRYETAHGLAADIRRFLRNEPILARPPSRLYRVGKLVRRHKLAFGAGAAVLAALVIAGVVLALALKLARREQIAAPAKGKYIAVLPFSNASPDKVEAYLTDSLTTELIKTLSKASGLSAFLVPALLSAKERELIFQFGLEFEGNVAWKQGGIVVSGRLSERAADGDLLLTNYIREPQKLLGVPNELALAIAEHSGIGLSTEDRGRIAKRPTESYEAYDSYLQGRFDLQGSFLHGPGTNAIPALERAVELDTRFALAYAELSRAYVLNYFYKKPEETTSLQGKAANAFGRALDLDPDLPEAHFAKGYFFWTHSQHWEVGKAIGEYRRALDLAPNSQELCDQMGLIFLHLGLFEEARQIGVRAQKINPLNPLTHYLEANALFWQGEDAEAVRIWQNFQDKLTLNFVMNSYEAVALVNLGRTNDADRLIKNTLGVRQEDLGGLLTSARAILLARQGDRSGAENTIKEALNYRHDFGHSHHALYNIASAYAMLNQQENALKYLFAAADDGFPCYPFFKVDKNLKNLWQNEEFKLFLAKQKKIYESHKKEFGKTSSTGGVRISDFSRGRSH